MMMDTPACVYMCVYVSLCVCLAPVQDLQGKVFLFKMGATFKASHNSQT